MRTYSKKPLSIGDQITHLINHNILIENQSVTSVVLNTIGYYRLSAYILPFKNESSRKDMPINFQQAIDLYNFDRKLRMIVIGGIEQIEVAIRSQWCHLLSTTTNDSHAYINNQYFLNPWEHQQQLARVCKQLNQSTEVFVNHYKANYSTPYLPPIWAMVETLTFGELSKWLTNTKNNQIKKQLAHAINLPTIEILQSVLHSLCMLRNICAHHGRLWNRLFVKRLPYIKKLRTVLTSIKPSSPDKNIYNYLVIITHILQTIEPKNPFKAELVNHIKRLDNKKQQIMGFPDDWYNLSFWR